MLEYTILDYVNNLRVNRELLKKSTFVRAKYTVQSAPATLGLADPCAGCLLRAGNGGYCMGRTKVQVCTCTA